MLRGNVRRKIDITLSLGHTKKFLSRLIYDTKKGKVPPQVSNATINGLNSLIKLHEIEEVQKWLASNVNKQARDELADSIPPDYTLED